MPMYPMTAYEERTWTPVLSATSVAGTHTYSTQSGWYTRIGNLVTAQFHCVIATKDGTASGAARITGLPYVSASLGIHNGALVISGATWPTGCTQIMGAIPSGTSLINLVGAGSGISTANLQMTDISDGSAVRGTITYRITP